MFPEIGAVSNATTNCMVSLKYVGYNVFSSLKSYWKSYGNIHSCKISLGYAFSGVLEDQGNICYKSGSNSSLWYLEAHEKCHYHY